MGEFVVFFLVNMGIMTTCSYLFIKVFHLLFKDWERLKEVVFIAGAVICGYLSMYVSIHWFDLIAWDMRFIPIVLAPLYLKYCRSILAMAVLIGGLSLTFELDNLVWTDAMSVLAVGIIVAFLYTFWKKRMTLFRIAIMIIAGNIGYVFVDEIVHSEQFPFTLTQDMIYFVIAGILVCSLIASLMKDMDNEITLRKAYEMDRYTDPLTGLYNVRYMREFMHNMKKGQRLAAMFMDIDYFKPINDKHGHTVGDWVLRRVAGQLEHHLSASGGTIFRYGGEEFLILFPNETILGAYQKAEEIRTKLEKHQFTHPSGLHLWITVSCGIAAYPNCPIDKLISQADEAMYRAKTGGRNRTCVS